MLEKKIQTALGFDFGFTKIGVAFGQAVTQTASPIKILKAKEGQPNWQEVEKLLTNFKPDALVIGLPLNMDDTENTVCTAAKKFAQRLHGRFGKPTYLIDERLSSTGVSYVLEEIGQNPYAKNQIDDLAACLILETFFKYPDHRPNAI